MNTHKLIDFNTKSILSATKEYILFCKTTAGVSPGCVNFKMSKTTLGKVNLVEEGTAGYGLTTFPLRGQCCKTYSPTPSKITLNVIDACTGKKASEQEWKVAIDDWIAGHVAKKKIAKAMSKFPIPKKNRPLVVSLTFYEGLLTTISYPRLADGFIVSGNDMKMLQQDILFHAVAHFNERFSIFEKFEVKV